MRIQPIIDLVLEEVARAERIYPGWPDDKIHQVAIISEKVGELVQAANDYQYQIYLSKDRMIEEAIQITAMGIRFLTHMMENK